MVARAVLGSSAGADAAELAAELHEAARELAAAQRRLDAAAEKLHGPALDVVKLAAADTWSAARGIGPVLRHYEQLSKRAS